MTQAEMIVRYDNAVNALEMLFNSLPPLSPFTVAGIIHLNFSGSDKEYLDGYISEIEELLVDKFGYADDYGRTEKASSRYYLSLNKSGIAAIRIGHKSYQKKANRKKLKEDYPTAYEVSIGIISGLISLLVGMLLM